MMLLPWEIYVAVGMVAVWFAIIKNVTLEKIGVGWIHIKNPRKAYRIKVFFYYFASLLMVALIITQMVLLIVAGITKIMTPVNL